ncbi:MAG: hypothetical protein HY900_09955 [Deltaproteobacteria bacterium]|nr:hypothetical protein [Deltaproteobacteria bacterium]
MRIAMCCAVVLSLAGGFAAAETGILDGTPQAFPSPTLDVGEESWPPVAPEELRATISATIERLEMEREELLIPPEGETPEEAELRLTLAHRKLRRIERLTADLAAL